MENLFSIIEDNRLEEVYVFGSWLTSGMPKDIDLLIVFDPQRCRIHEALFLRHQLARAVEDTFSLTSDIILLTTAEEREVGFVRAEGCVPFFSAVRAKCERPDE